MSNPIRVATAALSKRIYAGRPTKDGVGFKEPRYDVTSDVVKAIIGHIGVGCEATVNVDGEPKYRITVEEIVAVSLAPVGIDERARKLLAAEMRQVDRGSPDNGYLERDAKLLEARQLGRVDAWIALSALATTLREQEAMQEALEPFANYEREHGTLTCILPHEEKVVLDIVKRVALKHPFRSLSKDVG